MHITRSVAFHGKNFKRYGDIQIAVSTVPLVTACCHNSYLNPCWLLIGDVMVMWHSSKSIFTSARATIFIMGLKINILILLRHLPEARALTSRCTFEMNVWGAVLFIRGLSWGLSCLVWTCSLSNCVCHATLTTMHQIGHCLLIQGLLFLHKHVTTNIFPVLREFILTRVSQMLPPPHYAHYI